MQVSICYQATLKALSPAFRQRVRQRSAAEKYAKAWTQNTAKHLLTSLLVEVETEFEEAGLSECSYHTERLEELVDIACKHFKPSGFGYDYNNGCYDRYSVYSMSSESISISFDECLKVPAREKMLGMIKLKEILAEMKVPGETIERLTAL